MSADLLQLVASVEHLGELYGGAQPPSGACDLFYLHIDEREGSVTLGFDTRSLPANPPVEWEGEDFNAVEFYLVFTDVEGLRATGWGAPEARAIDLTFPDGGLLEVALGSEESGVAFRASAVRLAKTRPYLAWDTAARP
jgi:hypothetical protein